MNWGNEKMAVEEARRRQDSSAPLRCARNDMWGEGWVPACARATEGDEGRGGSALSGWFLGNELSSLLPNGQEDADDCIRDQWVADVD